MPITLTELANERSTFAITLAITDEAGAPVVPDTLTWSLTDLAGNIINSRSAVAITPPASSVTVVLSAADLALDGSSDMRVLTLEGTYDSSVGNNLPLKEEVRFTVQNLVKVKTA